MQLLLPIILAVFAVTGGCSSWFSPWPHLRPGIDRWGKVPDGDMATRSSWVGVMSERRVYDHTGRARDIVILEDVSGLNPRDVVDRSGDAIRSRPMPRYFHLEVENRLLASHPGIGSRVRVYGTLFTTRSGGVLQDVRWVSAFPPSRPPSTAPRDESDPMYWKYFDEIDIWPVVQVRRIEIL